MQRCRCNWRGLHVHHMLVSELRRELRCARAGLAEVQDLGACGAEELNVTGTNSQVFLPLSKELPNFPGPPFRLLARGQRHRRSHSVLPESPVLHHQSDPGMPAITCILLGAAIERRQLFSDNPTSYCNDSCVQRSHPNKRGQVACFRLLSFPFIP